MDPLTSLSLASSIIQIVDFSSKFAKQCRELYNNDALSEHEDLQEMATKLRTMCSTLNSHSHAESDDLSRLSRQCQDTAQALIFELQRFTINGAHRKRSVICKTLLGMWNKNRIDELLKRLDSYRSLLDSRILVDLRYVQEISRSPGPKLKFVNSDRIHLQKLQQRDDFYDLDQGVQAITIQLGHGYKQFDELISVINVESSSIKAHVTEQFRRQETERARNDHCQHFLESLWFPESDGDKRPYMKRIPKPFNGYSATNLLFLVGPIFWNGWYSARGSTGS